MSPPPAFHLFFLSPILDPRNSFGYRHGVRSRISPTVKRKDFTMAALKPASAAKPLSAAKIESAYRAAQARFADLGVNADRAVRAALAVPISIHCWQADDVKGLETHDETLAGGGIQATGNYPGAARNGDEIRADFELALGLLPGEWKFNLHASYAETGKNRVERDALEPRHFARWIDWAAGLKIGLDLNPTFFAHPMVRDGLTLSSENKSVRDFWIAHATSCRKVCQVMARRLGQPCVNNIWIPDGRKDSTADRWGPRARLIESLDRILAPKMSSGVIDAVESKLFGIGLEDYTVGSNEFYLLYAQSRGILPTYDLGHFHPTESVADKLSAVMAFIDKIHIHASRPIRWDSDHVLRLDDAVKALCDEAVRGQVVDRIYWATDFFDASINRIAAWALGARALRKGFLRAMLEPYQMSRTAEYAADGAAKLAVAEYREELPFGAVWDFACLQADAPTGLAWLAEIKQYETEVLAARK
jgi:L-rhamnose isomerase